MARPTQVKAVIFDFGGVLCFHPTEDRFASIAGLLGIPAQRLLEIFWANRIDYDAGLLDSRTYWTKVATAAGKPLNGELLAQLGQLEIELWNNFDKRVFAWAGHLRSHGVRTAMLSNLPQSLGEALLATPGLLDPFDHLTLSYRLKIVKPEAAIYYYAAHGLAVTPAEALFLDDKLENVEGARAIGMQAELYSTWEAFLSDAAGRYNLPMLLQSP
jgi:putative hydrolase of the HAD superfamily